jgi:hypothetical protein
MHLAGAGGNSPIDALYGVARNVRARLYIIDPRSEEGRGVRAVTQTIGQPFNGQSELALVKVVVNLEFE